MDSAINQRLKAFRKNKRYSQKELAKLLDVHPSYYSEVESGKRPVSAKIINYLIAEEKVSIEWINSGKGEMYVGDGVEMGGAISTLKANKNSLLEAPSEGGSIGGVPGGQENIKRSLEFAVAKFNQRLDNEFPELKTARDNAFYIIDFHSFTEKLIDEYLYLTWSNEKTVPSYFQDGLFLEQEYINDRINTLQKIARFGDALNRLKTAITHFYQDFQPFDDKGILQGHFTSDSN